MSASLSSRSGAGTAVGLLIGVLLAVLAGLIGSGWSVYTRERDQALTAQNLITRMENVIAGQVALEQDLSKLNESALSARVFLSAENAAIAVALLQDEISRMAGRGGVVIRRVTANDTSVAAANSVGIDIQVTGTLDQVSSFLLSIETHEPIFAIMQLSLNQLRARRVAADTAGGQGYVGAITVHAYYRGADNDGI